MVCVTGDTVKGLKLPLSLRAAAGVARDVSLSQTVSVCVSCCSAVGSGDGNAFEWSGEETPGIAVVVTGAVCGFGA